MKQALHIYILLFLLTIIPSVVLSQSSVQDDIDLYRLNSVRAKQKQYKDSLEMHRLLSIPTEKFITAYIERGFTGEGTSILWDRYYNRSSLDEQKTIIAQCYDLAAKHNDKGLKRLADLFKAWIATDDNDPYERKMELMEDIAHRCRKAGDRYLETFTLDRMWKASFYGSQHARCFEYGARLIEALEAIDDNYPHKYWGYSGVGKAYFAYKDYDRGAYYMKKAVASEPSMSVDMTALNHLAFYYQTKGNLDSAAYYHRLTITNMDHPVHLQIALCGLGQIYQEQGDIDGAIALFRVGLEQMKKDWAIYDFIYGVYTSLGECMLAKNDLPAVRACIREAKDGIFDFPDITNTNRLRAIYALESKYYSRIGRQDLAAIYLDSAILITQKYKELVGKDVILLGEQRLKDTEIDRQQERISFQRSIIFCSLSILALILVGLVVILQLYRKRNEAYKALAIKAKDWATHTVELEHQSALASELALELESEPAPQHESEPAPQHESEPEPTAPKPHPEITLEDKQIMLLLEKEMKNYAYREAGLTAEMLADRLGIHRNALSHAINRTTAGNFNTYINGFRIKEAVRLISKTSRKDLYIDELYESVGFGNRSSFSRVFKQFTGLSPIEFQKQEGTNPKN